MRELFRLSVLLVLGLVPALSIAADRKCDRACLQKFAEHYMRAVAANDVKAASLMPGYRQTQQRGYEGNFPLPASFGDAR